MFTISPNKQQQKMLTTMISGQSVAFPGQINRGTLVFQPTSKLSCHN